MILNKENEYTDTFLDINNDIYRIMTALNNDQSLKRLLVNTGNKPMQQEAVTKDLRDKQISRCPLLPYDEEEGSIVVVSVIQASRLGKTDSFDTTLCVDVFTPGNQWVIAEGLRPLMIAHTVDNIMRYKLEQTGGIKYRLQEMVHSQLSDILVGYRLIYEAVIDD